MKRFAPDTFNKKVEFVPDDGVSSIVGFSIDYLPQIKVTYRLKKATEDSEEIISCAEFVELMTFRARGKRINFPNIKSVAFIEPLPYDEPEEEPEPETPEDPDDDSAESLDEAVAKDIFKDITIDSGDAPSFGDEVGDQLSLF